MPLRLFTGPPAYVPRSGWPPALAAGAGLMIFAAGVFGALALLVAIKIVAVWLSMVIGLPSGIDISKGDITLGPGPIDGKQTVLYLLLSQATIILATLLAAGRLKGAPADVLALAPPRAGKRVYVEAFIGMVLVLVVINVISRQLNPGGFTADLKPFVGLINSDFWWVTLMAVGLGAPLSEELLFRGFLFSSFAASRFGIPGAAIATTAVWTALHAGYSIAGMIEVGLMGLYLSWVLWRTGSLRVTIFCHALYNTLLILALAVLPLPAT